MTIHKYVYATMDITTEDLTVERYQNKEVTFYLCMDFAFAFEVIKKNVV